MGNVQKCASVEEASIYSSFEQSFVRDDMDVAKALLWRCATVPSLILSRRWPMAGGGLGIILIFERASRVVARSASSAAAFFSW